MGAQLELSGRTGRLALLALLAAVAVWMAVGATQANASISLTPAAQGAGSIVQIGGNSPGYGGCDRTSNQNDAVTSSCGTAAIPTGTGSVCFPFGGCVTIPTTTTLVLAAIPSGTPSGHWRFLRWEGCPTPSGNVCEIGNPIIPVDVAPKAVFDDFVGPATTSASVVYSTTTDRGVTVGSFGGNETIVGGNCQYDGAGAFTPCGTARQLPEGTHQVRVQGIDQSGNVGGTSGVLATFQIVDTTLVSGPVDFSTDKRPTFVYSSLEGVMFECSIDSTTISTPCGTKDPLNNRASFRVPADLPDGEHTFRAEAIDGPDFDRVPIVRKWRVDTTAPVINNLASPTITEGVVTTALNATFTWAVTEVGGLDRFECKLDDADFAPCTSGKSFTDLPFGERKFTVRGHDKAGNVSPEVSRTWTVAARDNDGDGFNQRSDCDDGNPAVNPIAADIPDNGIDENCDGVQATDPDRDDDGFQPPADCNDSNAAIKPGVPDKPANGIDENCDGSDAKAPLVPATVSFNFPTPGQKSTKFTVFLVKSVPAGSKIVATCKGRACGKKPPKQTVKNAKGTVRLKKFQRAFKAGSVIEVRVTKNGMQGIVKLVKINKKKNPSITTRCLTGSKVVRCT